MYLREHMLFRVGGERETDAGGGECGEEGDATAVGEFVGGAGIRGAGRHGGRGMRGEAGRCGGRGIAGGAGWRGGRAVADGTAFAPRLFHVPPCGRVAMRSWRRDQADDLGEAEVADGFVAPDARGEDFAGDEDELRADGERVFLAATEEQAHAAAARAQGAADAGTAQAQDGCAAAGVIGGRAAGVLGGCAAGVLGGATDGMTGTGAAAARAPGGASGAAMQPGTAGSGTDAASDAQRAADSQQVCRAAARCAAGRLLASS